MFIDENKTGQMYNDRGIIQNIGKVTVCGGSLFSNNFDCDYREQQFKSVCYNTRGKYFYNAPIKSLYNQLYFVWDYEN